MAGRHWASHFNVLNLPWVSLPTVNIFTILEHDWRVPGGLGQATLQARAVLLAMRSVYFSGAGVAGLACK